MINALLLYGWKYVMFKRFARSCAAETDFILTYDLIFVFAGVPPLGLREN